MPLVKILRVLSLWLFWPGVAVIVWGELTPHPPHLQGPLDWDKVDHFIAYFGLASMATMVLGLRPRLAGAIAGVIGCYLPAPRQREARRAISTR